MQHSANAPCVHTNFDPHYADAWAEFKAQQEAADRIFARPLPRLHTGTHAELAERLVYHLTRLVGFRPICVRQKSTKSYLRSRPPRDPWPAPLYGPRALLYALDASGEWEPISDFKLSGILQAWDRAPTPVGDRPGRWLMLNNVERPIALAKAMCEQYHELPPPDAWRSGARPWPSLPPAPPRPPVESIPWELFVL